MSATPKGIDIGANLTLVKKGLILAAIPLFAQLIFLAVLFKMRHDQRQAQALAIHTKDVIAQTESAFRVVMEARSAVRSLALTGDTAFAVLWLERRQTVTAQFEALQKLVADNPAQQEKVEAILRQTVRVLDNLNRIVLLAERDATRAQALTELRQPWALEFLDELRGKINDFLHEEERLDAARQVELDRAMREQDWTLIGGVLLAVLSTGILGYAFRRGIALRLAVLLENVRRIGTGEELAPPLRGVDELGRLDRAFHDLADTLVQKDRENEMFVYSVSHDLRSPLVNLQGFSQELALICRDLRQLLAQAEVPAAVRERGTVLLDRDVGESIQFIQTAVRRLATIIDALLRLSRIGRVVYEWQQVDVRSVVERVVGALGNTIAQKGAKVVIGELPPVWGDLSALEQIFANLLGNALNYLDPARPGILEISCQNAQANDEWRTYYVKDNGLGIDAEHLPKIFLTFQRLHPEVAPGEGIGLPLVRRVVERHGGRIWVESAVGRGSTFFVRLPAQPRNGTPQTEPTA